MNYWFKDIEVTLKVRSLRVGGIEENVDLGAVPLKYTGSSIKGILRKSAKRVANSLGIKSFDKEIFGDENSEGKIQIFIKSNSENRGMRHGIKIDPLFGSVEQAHLFSYSFLITNELKFIIRPIARLTREEAKFLLYSLNYLRFDSIGGFGSRGMGLIEDVNVNEEFALFARGSV